LPVNIAVVQGTPVTLNCWSDAAGGNARVQWTEFAYNPNGNLISDGKILLPANPEAHRYVLNGTETHQYDLTISSAELSDGGMYMCVDAVGQHPVKYRHAAQLIVIAAFQNCTTTVPGSGIVLEDQYYTSECIVDFKGNIVPYMRWRGPQPFGQAQTNTATRCWSGKSFYAHRTMTGQKFISTVNFTNNFPVPEDTADNIPDHEHEWEDGPRLFVNWSPKNMYADPVKPLNEYEVGDVLECFADAYPTASFQWHNLRTNERTDGSLFTIHSGFVGFEQLMRCEATNLINGMVYTGELLITVRVPEPTTPTTPSTTPTTTTAPPVSDCLDLTGRWESVQPLTSAMCIEIDKETGNFHGVVRNHTDTFWVDLVGMTDVPNYSHVSFTGIWPLNRAVSTFIAECSRCYGDEHLIVSAISRSKGGPPCATPGEIHYSQEYHFFRNPQITCPPITIPTFEK